MDLGPMNETEFSKNKNVSSTLVKGKEPTQTLKNRDIKYFKCLEKYHIAS